MELPRIIFSILFISYNAMASKSARDITSANEKLAAKLFAILAKNGDNVLYSPYSLHAIFSLLYQGTAGNTTKSFENVLYLSGTQTTAEGYQNLIENLNSVKKVTLAIANKVFVQQQFKLKEEFRSVAKNQFLSEVENVNFTENVATAEHINEWVERKTNKKITDIIEKNDLDESTRLVLVNAIYFKGNWKYRFNKTATQKAKFYLSKTDFVECDMMHTGILDFRYSDYEEVRILSLPYENENMNLMIILPRSENMDINDLERVLQNRTWTSIYENMKITKLVVSLPKFKVETEIDLEDPLTKMGLGVIFSDKADFSNLLDSTESLKVSKAVQKAFLEVDEVGTEASGATVVETVGKIGPPYQYFNADHPFVFALTYNLNGTVLPLFIGKLAKI